MIRQRKKRKFLAIASVWNEKTSLSQMKRELSSNPEEDIELKDKYVAKEELYENTTLIGEYWYFMKQTPLVSLLVVKDRRKVILADEFGEHVQRMHADRDKWFELEYNVSGLVVSSYSDIAGIFLCCCYYTTDE